MIEYLYFFDSTTVLCPRAEIREPNSLVLFGELRTEVRGDFNIHGTKYF